MEERVGKLPSTQIRNQREEREASQAKKEREVVLLKERKREKEIYPNLGRKNTKSYPCKERQESRLLMY